MALSRSALLSLALLAGTSVAESLASGGGWVSPAGSWLRYPLPGAEVKSLVADPAQPGGYYLGTAQGGIYRSTDGGRSWSGTTGGSPYPGYSVTSLVVDPGRSGEVWAGLTGVLRGGLLARSVDHGRTWNEVRRWPERAAARVVAVSVLGGGRRVVAVGGDYGVEISVDEGATWRSSAPDLDPGSGISFIAFHPLKEGILYCGSFRHPFRSTDLGRTWSRIANGMVEDTEVFALDFSRTNPDDYWAATCGWVYRTKDGAASWTRYRDGLLDRRTHTISRDPSNDSRVLAGTTGGLFESRDAGKSFRRIAALRSAAAPEAPAWVVNALAFDPRNPSNLLIGTESEGVLRSEDGGLTVEESNTGLAEARIAAVAETASGSVLVARSADGRSGGLWRVDPQEGTASRVATSPPSTIVALLAVGETLLAGTHDGVYLATGNAESPSWTRTLTVSANGFAADGSHRILSATEQGVHESRDGGQSWKRLGSLTSRVLAVRRARFPELSVPTFAADSDGRTHWWDGRDWVFQAVRLSPGSKLTGGFGRPRAAVRFTPEPIGLEIDPAKQVLLFRPDVDGGPGVALAFPEAGLNVAGWSGDPRTSSGLYLATMGRGLFRFVPSGTLTRLAAASP